MVNERSSIVSNPNTISVFGGEIDEGETPIEGAEREFREETLHDGPLELYYIGKTKNESTIYYTYLGFSDSMVEPMLNEESDDYHYMSIGEILNQDNLHPKFKQFLVDNKSRILDLVSEKMDDN